LKAQRRREDAGWLADMRVGRKMVLAFGALIATLALSSIVFLVAQQRAASARAWMEHTREVIEDIMLLRAATLDQESALRGYLLSGAPDFLATYDAGRKQFEQALAALFALTSDDAAQQARLQQAQAIAGAWRSEFAEPAIRLAEHAETRPQAVASVVRREGRRHTDALRQLYTQMSVEEARLLEERRQHLQRADQLMVWLTAGLLGLGVALGVFATRTTTRLIAGPLRTFTELMPRLASGDRELRIPHLARRDEIGKVAQALDGLRGANLRQHERDWIKSRLAEISGALQHCDSHQDFGATLLRLLSPALGAGYGLAYRYDENLGLLEYCAGYGTPDAKAMQQRFRPGEGLPGQCMVAQAVAAGAGAGRTLQDHVRSRRRGAGPAAVRPAAGAQRNRRRAGAGGVRRTRCGAPRAAGGSAGAGRACLADLVAQHPHPRAAGGNPGAVGGVAGFRRSAARPAGATAHHQRNPARAFQDARRAGRAPAHFA